MTNFDDRWEARRETIDRADQPGWGPRSAWPKGPWDNEPDKVEWFGSHGYPLLIVRNGAGALCGYIGVPKGHPWYNKGYDDIDPHPDCNGGLTYAGIGNAKISHFDAPGVFWLGFDCAHCYDFCPGMAAAGFALETDKSYKNIAYVRGDCESLAIEAHRAAQPPTFRHLADEID